MNRTWTTTLMALLLLGYCSPIDGWAENFCPIDANLYSQDIIIPAPGENSHFTTLAIAGWLQAATLQPGQGNGYLTIDYLEVIELDPATNQERVIYLDHYNNRSGQLRSNEGGLYVRYPNWYNSDAHSPLTNSEVGDGFLTINVGAEPDSISHWWTPRLNCLPDRWYFLEICLKVQGDISIQVGLDYWIHPDSGWAGLDINNTEAWHSDWYGGLNDFIVIKVPITFQSGFDYGVTSSGIMFISDRMVRFNQGLGDYVFANGTLTSWQEQLMIRQGDLYVCQTADSLAGPATYCFKVTAGFIPPLGSNALITKSDTIANSYGGYNFQTQPVAELPSVIEPGLAGAFQLNQNYPNPFNGVTIISYDLPSVGQVTLEIYNSLGERINSLLTNRLQGAGLHQIVYDASHLVSGIYFCAMQSNGLRQTRKIVLIK